MQIHVNGTATDVPENIDVAMLLVALGHPDRGVAVAVEDVVVPKGQWSSTPISAGQHIEILTAVQGG